MINRTKSPVRVDLVLNQDCNHKCLHCYNPWRDSCKAEKMSLSAQEVNDKIKIVASELAEAEIWSVILTGGEPFLHPDILFKCIEAFSSLGISMSINTNLTLMTPEIVDQLINKYHWENIILTSLPAIDETLCDEITQVKGSYKRIVENIDYCVSRGLRIGINTVITKKNIGDLKRYSNFVSKHKIDYVSISTVIPPIYDATNPMYYLDNDDIINIADTLLELKNVNNIDIGSVTPLPLCVLKDANKYMPVLDTTCLAGISKCTIDLTSGAVHACAHEEQKYGNIFVEGLQSCWDKMESWATPSHLNLECVDCKWLFICGGECRMVTCGNRGKTAYTLDKTAEVLFGTNQYQSVIKWPDSNELLQINKSFKFRKESFGYLVRCDYVETALSAPLFELCQRLREEECFSLNDLSKYIENINDAKPVISTLLQRHIIERYSYELS